MPMNSLAKQQHKYERRSLLSQDGTSSETATEIEISDDDDDEFLGQGIENLKKKSTLPGSRHQIHRGARKLTTRLSILTFIISTTIVFAYISVYNSVQLRRAALSGWGYNTSRNTADYVLPNNDTTLTEPCNICQSNTFILIVVCSAVNNFAARQNIRETWGNTSEFNYQMFSQLHPNFRGKYLDRSKTRIEFYKKYLVFNNTIKTNSSEVKVNSTDFDTDDLPEIYPIRVVFLIGRSEYENQMGNETTTRLKLESEQYDDLIQENFIDTYNNLTLKSVMMLKWVTKNCLDKTAFVVKCDDDTFINVPNLVHYLLGGTIPIYNDTIEYYDIVSYKVMANKNRLNMKRNILMGFMFCSVRPIADVSNKWYTPSYMFPGDKYPTYLSGGSYLMSIDVVPQLYYATLNSSLLHLEDVYITGICAEKIHLKRRHNSLFRFNNNTKKFCSFRGTISQHYVKGDLMREAYSFVTNTTIKCSTPGKYFKTIRVQKRPKICN